MLTAVSVTSFGRSIDLLVDCDVEPAEEATSDSPGSRGYIGINRVWHHGMVINKANDVSVKLTDGEVSAIEEAVASELDLAGENAALAAYLDRIHLG